MIKFHQDSADEAQKEAYRWFVKFLQTNNPREKYYYNKFKIEVNALRRHLQAKKELENSLQERVK